MVVIASRQAGQRPETIRTRLARFMPKGPAAGWSVAWSAHTERAEDMASEDELAAAEHLSCFGSAVAHSLARAEIAPTHLRISAEAAAAPDGVTQPFTVEVRATIPGLSIEPSVFEMLVRRADPSCPVWKSLATDDRMRLVAMLDDTLGTPRPNAPVEQPAAKVDEPPPVAAPMPSVGRTLAMPVALPKWVTPRFAGMVAVAVVVLAARVLFLG